MKKTFLVVAVLICTLIAFSIPSMAAAPTYLFITSGTDATIDDTLIARIKTLGFDVVVKAHDDFDAVADSAGKIAVYISESVASANITDAFNNVAIPMVISEAYMIEDMGFCAETAEVDFGSNTESVKGTVIKPDHPIMKGVAKDFVFVTKELDPPANTTWAVVPAKNALAVDPDNPDRAVVWAFEKGESTVDSIWPAYKIPEKRCGINWHTTMSIDAVSADLWKIFDNSIIWAAGVDPLAPVETAAPETEAPVVADPAVAAPVTVVSPKTADAGIAVFALAAVTLCTVLTLKKKK